MSFVFTIKKKLHYLFKNCEYICPELFTYKDGNKTICNSHDASENKCQKGSCIDKNTGNCTPPPCGSNNICSTVLPTNCSINPPKCLSCTKTVDQSAVQDLKNKKLIGHNTDIYGFEKAINKINFKVTGKKIFILGAGGVVPSIIYALNKMGAFNIFISNRTRAKAQMIKDIFKNLNTTKNGFQATIDIFKNPSKKISLLKSIIIDELDTYYSKFKNENCSYIKKWPLEKKIAGWHVILKQQGHQISHIHPSGWLSGVIYLKVVPSKEKSEGAIEFRMDSPQYPNLESSKKIYQPNN